MSDITLTEEQVRTLWIVLLYGKTVGDRIILGRKILGDWPDDVFGDDDECQLCGAERDNDKEE